jgi:hypothetical protein
MAAPMLVAIARREGHETYFTFHPRNERWGQRIYRMLRDLISEGKLDERCFIIVALPPANNSEVTVVVPALVADHDEQINSALRECTIRLSRVISRMSDDDQHGEYAAMSQRARAQDN